MSKGTIICGMHAVKAALHAAPEKAVTLWVDRHRRDQRMQAIVDSAKQYGVDVVLLNRDALDDKAQVQNHQGVVLHTSASTTYDDRDIDTLLEQSQSPPLLLALDGITDPHNLGACLRTAEAAGVDFVITTKDRAVGLNPTVRKAASGAAERLPFVQVTNLSRTLKQLQEAGLWITGAAMEGELFQEADMTGPRVIVMGSEGKGIRRLTREHCDQLIHIPMAGEVESLNVSVATGVVLFEVLRQRSLEGRHDRS